jgi:hypothetical protein
MAIQTINIGNVVNDGLGDDLRTAFQKVNANFTDLSTSLTVTASNLGTAGEGVFREKTGTDLRFRRLLAGTKITLDSFTDSIRINSSQPDAFTSVTTNNGTITANNTANTTDITIQGGQGGRNIQVTATGSVISIDSVLDLNQILLSYDFGGISGDYEHPIQLALSTANIDFGTIVNPGRLSLDLGSI